MNRALLSELQRQTSYPSITVLVNTTPGSAMSPSETDTTMRLIAQVDDRLDGDVSDTLRHHLVAQVTHLLDDEATVPATHALALFVSPDHCVAVRLGRTVQERVTIDDTFTTRDLVADLNRTALYRVVTVSERTVRLFVGDRQRLVEQRDDAWPLVRTDEHTPALWNRDVSLALRAEQASHRMPTVVAGVQRSVRTLVPRDEDTIGVIPGNHDRTSATDLHHAAWPLVSDWLRTDGARALRQLDDARSANRFAGGIHEIWPLANDGRIATLVVESSFSLAARSDANRQVVPADDPHHPEVHDDIVDDAIETVLRHGGSTVIVDDGALDDSDRIAAVLRY